MTTTLHNKGERQIQVAGIDFKPGETVKFDKDDADRLLRLYPTDVYDVNEKVVKVATKSAVKDVSTAPEKPAEETKAEDVKDNNVLTKAQKDALKKEAKANGFKTIEEYTVALDAAKDAGFETIKDHLADVKAKEELEAEEKLRAAKDAGFDSVKDHEEFKAMEAEEAAKADKPAA